MHNSFEGNHSVAGADAGHGLAAASQSLYSLVDHLTIPQKPIRRDKDCWTDVEKSLDVCALGGPLSLAWSQATKAILFNQSSETSAQEALLPSLSLEERKTDSSTSQDQEHRLIDIFERLAEKALAGSQ